MRNWGSDSYGGQSKPRRGRRAYLDDFTRTADGSYIYTGDTFTFRGGMDARRRYLATLCCLAAVALAAAVAAGCISAPGTGRCPYVLLPYCLSLIASGSLAWGAGRLAIGGDPLRAYVYTTTVKRFPRRSALTALCAAAAIAGEAVYLALYGAGELALGAAIFLTCHGLILASALVWLRLSRREVWEPSRMKR